MCGILPNIFIQASGEEIENIGFTVEPIFPENQVNKNLGYFDLITKPGEKQTIQLKISSLKKEPVVVDIGVTNATTNRYGKIDYGQHESKLDSSQKLPLTEIVTIDKEFQQVTVQNFEEKIVSVSVDPPEEAFEGIKLGAITLIDSAENNKLENDYGYRIGILLNEDRKNYSQFGSLILDSVSAGLDNGFEMIKLEFRNPTPQVIKKLTVDVEIREKGYKKVIESFTFSDGSIAPNSQFVLGIPWDIKKIGIGLYDVKIIAKNTDKEWSWSETLEVKMTKELEDVGIVLSNQFLKNHRLLFVLILVVMFFNVILIAERLRRSFRNHYVKGEHR